MKEEWSLWISDIEGKVAMRSDERPWGASEFQLRSLSEVRTDKEEVLKAAGCLALFSVT
jgi:hypothetical protein